MSNFFLLLMSANYLTKIKYNYNCLTIVTNGMDMTVTLMQFFDRPGVAVAVIQTAL